MQVLIDKLRLFKDNIDKAQVLNKDFADLVGIKAFSFITEENDVLKDEFYKRFYYFQNLTKNEGFLSLQANIFELVNSINDLSKTHKVKDLTNKLNRCALRDFDYKYCTNPDQEDYYLSEVKMISRRYQLISDELRLVTLPTDQSKELLSRYGNLLYKLDQQINLIPIKQNFQHFERFFLFGCEAYMRDGYENFFIFWKHTNNQELKLRQVKESSRVVIDDLIYFLQNRDGEKLVSEPLRFYSDGMADYFNNSAQFKIGTKCYVLINFLKSAKNTKFSVEDIREYCNDDIKNKRHEFKTEKDVIDTILSIRRKLKVKIGNSFPIQKKEKSFIWREK